MNIKIRQKRIEISLDYFPILSYRKFYYYQVCQLGNLQTWKQTGVGYPCAEYGTIPHKYLIFGTVRIRDLYLPAVWKFEGKVIRKIEYLTA